MAKALMFMIFMWLVVSIAGGMMQGSNPLAATLLTVAIDEDDTTITVTSTEGFLDTGSITIGDERIGYPETTATTFEDSATRAVVRGYHDTEALSHSVGEIVRTTEGGMLNQSLAYQIATLTDASGVLGFVTIPFKFISLLLSFFILPLSFLGTDLEILTYLWAVLSISIIASLAVSLIGGRRMG